jgi:hypothetical protein
MRHEGNEGCDFYAHPSTDIDIDKLGTKQITSASAAVRAILYAALVYSVGEASAHERHREIRADDVFSAPIGLRVPLTRPENDEGGFCTAAGCYVWANPWDPTGGGPGGGWGGGTGGTGSSSGGSGPPPDPPAIPADKLPDPEKILCGAREYGSLSPKWGPALNNIWAFAQTAHPDIEAFSFTSPLPPPGYASVLGDTGVGTDWYEGGVTILYAGAMSPQDASKTFFYTDIATGKIVTEPGPFTAFEWSLVTFAHEVGHQYGFDDEDDNDAYGYAVLKGYRDDGGKKCL